jgi:hypothetical protein
MSKAIEGAAMIGAAVGMFAFAVYDPEMFLNPLYLHAMEALAMGGIAMEAGAIAGALTSNRGMNITTRQAASFRQIIYGTQRVGGVEIFRSTTGSHHDQFNYVIVLATHVIDAVENLYLDGRQVFWNGSNTGGNGTRNGCNFGGPASGGTKTGPDGAHYNFDTLVYCEARFGDQVDGDYITGLTANDRNWAPAGGKTPWVGGCAYVYLKVEYDTAMFPGEPEIRFTVRGKCDILDPRTGLAGYTNNWALVVADVLSDPVNGVGDGAAVNTAQLIAAANICDEQVACAAGLEARYTCNWHYDTSTAPGDVLDQMMAAAAGRLSRIGGQWFIWPAYWQGPSFTFDANVLAGKVNWTPNRGLSELFNRVNGTYVAPNYPYNVAGNLYDSNGWYYGTIANQFPYGFQPTNYPQYASDVLHGYADDQYLLEDGGIVLPREIGQQCVLSIAQAQRVAKIYLLRNRQQGTGTLVTSLAAWGMQPCDVILFDFPAADWEQKQLEVTGTRFRIGEGGGDSGEADAPKLWLEFDIAETDPSVYEWSAATEELTPYDVPSTLTGSDYTPAPPTDMTLASLGLAIVGADGIAIPRVQINWVAPEDVLVTRIAIQHQASGAGSWTDDGTVGVVSIQAFVTGVVAGGVYNFRIASLRANGAMSPWVEIDGYTVAMTMSALPAAVIASGTLAAERLPSATATTQGAVTPDGTTITIANGVLSAVPAASAVPVTPSATPLFDGDAAGAGGTLFTLTLDRNVTGGSVQNLTPGQQYYFLIEQPPAAAFSFQWPANLANAQPVAVIAGMRSLQAALAVTSSSLLAGTIQYFTS